MTDTTEQAKSKKAKLKKQRYDVKMTERFVLRVTTEQMRLLREVAPEQYSGGMSSIWRAYILYLAHIIREYRDGVINKEGLENGIRYYAINITNEVLFFDKMDKIENAIESYNEVRQAQKELDESLDGDIPF